jgi:hypothetical protein
VSASQELTYGLTSFVVSFTSLVFVKQMPNYACQFLLQLQKHALWPIDLDKLSLQKIVNALSTVRVPVLESHTYPHSPFDGPDSEDGDDEMPTGLVFPWGSGGVGQAVQYRPRHQPSQRTLVNLAERVREHCTGLCLDCFRGNEQCRLPHPTLRKAQTFVVSRPVVHSRAASPSSSYAGWSHRWD